MSRHIASIREVYLQNRPGKEQYRIYIRVYLETRKKIVLTVPDEGTREGLTRKYDLLQSAFKNIVSGIESRRCVVRSDNEKYSFEGYL